MSFNQINTQLKPNQNLFTWNQSIWLSKQTPSQQLHLLHLHLHLLFFDNNGCHWHTSILHMSNISTNHGRSSDNLLRHLLRKTKHRQMVIDLQPQHLSCHQTITFRPQPHSKHNSSPAHSILDRQGKKIKRSYARCITIENKLRCVKTVWRA